MTTLIVDPATGGIAGLYLEAYVSEPLSEKIVAVGAYEAWSRGICRYFYRRTDLASDAAAHLGRFRLPLRYWELIVGLFRCAMLALKLRPRALFYALSSNLVPELAFIRFMKLCGVKVLVVCHDVVPFVMSYESRGWKNSLRSRFYRAADLLVVHNEQSFTELCEMYGIGREKLRYIPFPLMDLRPFANEWASTQAGLDVCIGGRPRRFLFIGHVRREKGVDLLIDAWRRVAGLIPNAHLTVAGQLPSGVDIGDVAGLTQFQLLNRYIPEKEYAELIAMSDVVVFPYRAGTNSGVLSNVVSLAKPIIASDIAMFRQSGLVPADALFPAGDVVALGEKLRRCARMSDAELAARRKTMDTIRAERSWAFKHSLDALLTELAGVSARLRP